MDTYKELMNYIKEIYKKSALKYNKFIVEHQIEELTEDTELDKGLSYDWILYTLKYVYELSNDNVKNYQKIKVPVEIVPFYYGEARKYHDDMIKLQKEIDNFVFEDKVVTIYKNFDNTKKRKDLTFD